MKRETLVVAGIADTTDSQPVGVQITFVQLLVRSVGRSVELLLLLVAGGYA